jgi:hypothetical protein
VKPALEAAGTFNDESQQRLTFIIGSLFYPRTMKKVFSSDVEGS